MQVIASPAEIGVALSGRRFIDAEFMYKPRPTPGRERLVFDAALRSRLDALSMQDAVLLIGDSVATLDSLSEIEALYPHLTFTATLTNPTLWQGQTVETPRHLNWPEADRWRHYQQTDRWSRIDAALSAACLIKTPGYLIMPAHDAVWGRDLLPRLIRLSEHYAAGGLPAAVSPCTYYQLSAVPGAALPPEVIDLMNTAFGRDCLFGWKLRTDRVQAFWGKMAMLPFGMCGAILDRVDQQVWEDDLEIDRVIRALGYGVRCTWVREPTIYRQAPPVFDREGLCKVIERTLHYSLNIPSARIGESLLNFPLGPLGQVRAILNPKFRRYNALAEKLIAECNQTIAARLRQFGASWVDWGRYRYVMRVGDPAVEVWRQESD